VPALQPALAGYYEAGAVAQPSFPFVSKEQPSLYRNICAANGDESNQQGYLRHLGDTADVDRTLENN
jgi:hypothetical protein